MKSGDTVILKEDFITLNKRYRVTAGSEFDVIDVIDERVVFNLDVNGAKYKTTLPASRFRVKHADSKMALLDEAARFLDELSYFYDPDDVHELVDRLDKSKLLERIKEVLDE